VGKVSSFYGHGRWVLSVYRFDALHGDFNWPCMPSLPNLAGGSATSSAVCPEGTRSVGGSEGRGGAGARQHGRCAHQDHNNDRDATRCMLACHSIHTYVRQQLAHHVIPTI
jgi:hypothetical protein